MSKQDDDFVSVLERVQGASGDMGSLFNPTGKLAFEPRPQPGGANGARQAHEANFQLFDMADVSAADAYVEICNLILQGEAVKLFEDRTFTKEGAYLIAVCYAMPRRPAPAVAGHTASDAEPDVKARRI